MRLLLINGNTTAFVTETAAVEARYCCQATTEIVAVTATFGAAIIATRVENAIAEHAMVELAARHAGDCDAALIAVSFDTGLRPLRELLAMPVVGMTEAALLTGCMLGGQVGLVSFGLRAQPLYRELVRGYGLDGRIAGWRNLEAPSVYRPGDTSEVDQMIVAAARDLVQHNGAEVIILLGAVMAGAPRRVQRDVPVPVLDGIGCGVRQAELLVHLAAPKPSAGSYAPPGKRALGGVDAAVVKALGDTARD
jgi:allantoin racemase